jgi:hypothetical protein
MTTWSPREPVRRPIAWQLHPDDMAWFFAAGKHCEARRPRKCRRFVTVVTWRWWRSAVSGRVVLSEHVVCTEHGREFARRHGIKIDPPPDAPSWQPRSGEGGPR